MFVPGRAVVNFSGGSWIRAVLRARVSWWTTKTVRLPIRGLASVTKTTARRPKAFRFRSMPRARSTTICLRRLPRSRPWPRSRPTSRRTMPRSSRSMPPAKRPRQSPRPPSIRSQRSRSTPATQPTSPTRSRAGSASRRMSPAASHHSPCFPPRRRIPSRSRRFPPRRVPTFPWRSTWRKWGTRTTCTRSRSRMAPRRQAPRTSRSAPGSPASCHRARSIPRATAWRRMSGPTPMPPRRRSTILRRTTSLRSTRPGSTVSVRLAMR